MEFANSRFLKCPYDGCDGKIDALKQSRVTGGGIFVCLECNRRAFIQNNGQLATEEEYGRDYDLSRET